MDHLGEALSDHRKRSLLTQTDLAALIGVRRQTIARAETGNGTLKSFMIILATLGLTLLGLPEESTLGDRIRAKRLQVGLTQREMSARAGVALGTLVALETRSTGRMNSLILICRALGADIRLRKGKSFFAAGATDAWNSPKWLMDILYEVFGQFDLDPCAGLGSHVRADRHLFKNGLEAEWRGRVFVNPPYSQCQAWARRCARAYMRNESQLVVALLPVRTSTVYWHEAIADLADILLFRGRLRFGSEERAAPFPSALAVYGASAGELAELMKRLPVQLIPARREVA